MVYDIVLRTLIQLDWDKGPLLPVLRATSNFSNP